MIVPFFITRTDTVVVTIADKVKVDAPFDWLTPALVILGWVVVHFFQRWLQKEQFRAQQEAQRRHLYDQARYDSWLRAANAIETYRFWLLELWHRLEELKTGGDVEAIYKHMNDPRPGELSAAIGSADLFFPGLNVAFAKHSDAVIATLQGDWKDAPGPILALHRAVREAREEWRKRVHKEVWTDPTGKEGEPVPSASDTTDSQIGDDAL